MLPMTSTNSQKLDSWIHISEVLVWMKSVIDFKLLSRPVLEKKVMFYVHLPRTNHDKSNQTDPVMSLHVSSAC